MRSPILDDLLYRLHHVLCDIAPDVREGIEAIISEMVSAWLNDSQSAYLFAQKILRQNREIESLRMLLELATLRAMPLLPPSFLVEGQDRGWLPPMKQTKLPEDGIAALLERKAG